MPAEMSSKKLVLTYVDSLRTDMLERAVLKMIQQAMHGRSPRTSGTTHGRTISNDSAIHPAILPASVLPANDQLDLRLPCRERPLPIERRSDLA